MSEEQANIDFFLEFLHFTEVNIYKRDFEFNLGLFLIIRSF